MIKTILVVDDEEKIRDVVVSYLKKDGFQAVEAATGGEALDALHRVSVDLVILDLMLPDMHGEQVCQTIRKMNSVPILMLTAKVSGNNRIKGYGKWSDGPGEKHDYMGFSMADNGFYSSGHPAAGSTYKNPMGLIPHRIRN